MSSDLRLLYVATGGLQAALAPARVKWLLSTNPGMEVIVGITPMTLRFTTRTSLEAFGKCSVVLDSWEDESSIHHVELAAWPDAVIVHPMTFDYAGKMAAGLGSGPVMLALQMISAPMVLCPGFPPGLWESPIARENLRRITLRQNVLVLPPGPAESARTGAEFTGAPAEFEHAFASMLEHVEIARGHDV